MFKTKYVHINCSPIRSSFSLAKGQYKCEMISDNYSVRVYFKELF